MKVGFIVESGRNGAEKQVLPYLAEKIRRGIETHVVTLNKKPILKRECGKAVKRLFSQGYDRVFILWDLLPDWDEYDGKGCLHMDREEIHQSLQTVGLSIDDPRISLVCIHKMLEAWIIADERAISEFLSTTAHKVSIKRRKNSESIKDPKSALSSMFKSAACRISRYEDHLHAIKIAEKMPDLKRLSNLPSFKRFKEKLEA